MNIQSPMTPDALANIGRTLYGERWQTPLANELHVAERNMRRWLAGEFPIPDGIKSETRKLMIKRLVELGLMVGYEVISSERRIFHYPTAACFQYDDEGKMTLLNPNMVAPSDIPLLTQGAEEALHQERERDSRGMAAMQFDQTGRFASPIVNEEYNGYVITYPRTRMLSDKWRVEVSSNNPHLLMKLGGNGNLVIEDHISLNGAIEKAKRLIDEME